MPLFDIAVIGAGPGGYAAALRGARKGARVCLVEQNRLGGTCLHRGCIPVKALYGTARLLAGMRQLEEHGIRIEGFRFDLKKALRRKDKVVSGLEKGIEGLLKSAGVERIHGRAVLEGPNRIRINAKETIETRSVIIATGARPLIPAVLAKSPGMVLTSDDFLALESYPERLLVVGGGYIGCELAGIAALFGSRVTLVEQLPELLAGLDRQAVREMEKSFRELGIEVIKGSAVEGLGEGASGVRVTLVGRREKPEVDRVLVAAGRFPNSAGLGLEQAGVMTENGAVRADAGMRTSLGNVFAIGDVTGILQLAHVADHQGEVAVENALGGNAEADYRIVPTAIFTFPEIAQVGLSEAQCRESQRDYLVGTFPYQASGKAQCDGDARGAARLLASPSDGRLLGGTVFGAGASQLIAEVAAAMRGGLTAGDVAHLIHAHPSLSEIIKETAADVLGASVHKAVRRGRPLEPTSGARTE
ncbi:MAG: dihydrolipoyl dehydrogenase [Deltaproteobacteria bacterium]|nr:dihydrolipoyl dehydrogenase [Deltaproteobacteria bacterium]